MNVNTCNLFSIFSKFTCKFTVLYFQWFRKTSESIYIILINIIPSTWRKHSDNTGKNWYRWHTIEIFPCIDSSLIISLRVFYNSRRLNSHAGVFQAWFQLDRTAHADLLSSRRWLSLAYMVDFAFGCLNQYNSSLLADDPNKTITIQHNLPMQMSYILPSNHLWRQ